MLSGIALSSPQNCERCSGIRHVSAPQDARNVQALKNSPYVDKGVHRTPQQAAPIMQYEISPLRCAALQHWRCHVAMHGHETHGQRLTRCGSCKSFVTRWLWHRSCFDWFQAALLQP